MTRRPASRGPVRRRPLPILAFVVASLVAFLMPAVRPDPVDAQITLNSQATLTVLSAPVEVQRASGNRDMAASGTTLVVGDRVFTGAGGTAKLTFFQGTEVDIAPDTELMVQEMTQRVSGASTVSFGQAVGSTVAKVASLFNPASRVQVSTQSAVAVVRGTELEITVTKEQVQVFKSVSGNFDVVAGGQVQRVKDGEVTVVPPPPPAPAPPTTRDSQTVGNASVALPGGNDRPPLPPVPVAEAATLFEKVSEIIAKDGPPVVVTPPVAARDLIDVAQGKPVVLRPIGATPVARPTKASPEPTKAPPEPTKELPEPTKVRPEPTKVRPEPTKEPPEPTKELPEPTKELPEPTCVTATSTPTADQFGFGGQVVDMQGTPLGCATVKVGEYGGATFGSSKSDASGAFRVLVPTPASGATTGTFAFTAISPGYTQRVVPTLSATAGRLAIVAPLVLATNDSTLTGIVSSGATPMPVSDATVALVVAVPSPVGGTSQLAIPVASATTGRTGAYILAAASGTYSYLVASQHDVALYAHRSVTVAAPPLMPTGIAPVELVLPTLATSGPLACDQHGAPCSVAISGSGWAPSDYVSISAVDVAGNRRTFGSISTSRSGEIASQVLVAHEPAWPTGTYALFAAQGYDAPARYVQLASSYVVSAGTLASSCAVTDASGMPSGSQFKVTGLVKDVAGTPVPNACVQVTDVSSGRLGFGASGADGAFAVMVPLTASTGTFAIVATRPGYTAQSVPTVAAVAGQVLDTTTVVAGGAIRLARNDATISGTVTSGTGGPPVTSGAAVSVSVLPVTTSGVTGSLVEVGVATVIPGADGAYSLSVASGIYKLQATQSGVAPYSHRLVSMAGFAVQSTGMAPANLTLPTLSTTGSLTCDQQNGLPCSITVAGSGWSATGPVNIYIGGQIFGSVTPSASGEFPSQTVVAASASASASWPAGTYQPIADQRTLSSDGRPEYRLANLDTSYVVGTGAMTSAPTGTVTSAPTGTVTSAPTGTVTPAPTGTVTPAPTGTVTPSPTGTETPVARSGS